MANNGKVLLALLGGAAAGVALGLLFAPEKGTETRRKIAEGAKDLTDSLQDKFTDVKSRVTEKVNEVRGKTSDVTETEGFTKTGTSSSGTFGRSQS